MKSIQGQLRKVIERYGHRLCDDARRCRALLNDLCPGCRRETNVLITAIEDGVVRDLLKPMPGLPMGIANGRLQRRLHDNHGLADDAAKWAVETWGFALTSASLDGENLRLKCPSCSGIVSFSGSAIGYVIECTGCLRQIRVFAQGAECDVEPDAAYEEPVQTILVSQDGKGQFTSILDAVSAALPDARILVRPGTYVQPIKIDRPVSILGDAGRVEEVVIEIAGHPCIEINGGDSFFRGLTLRVKADALVRRCPAIEVSKGRLRVEECHIRSGGKECINVHGDQSIVDVIDCHLSSERGDGLAAWNNAAVTIENTHITKCRGNGIVLDHAKMTLRGSRITASGYFGINAKTSDLSVEEADISDNADTGVTLSSCTFSVLRSTITGNRGRGVLTKGGSKGFLEDLDLSNNRRGASFSSDDCDVRKLRIREN